ncbi:hypothetical protein JXQ70_20765 [bacterium]|nr:hypothetical protein [bacterium]
MDKKPKEKIVFKYVIPDGIRDCFINGAFGGANQSGHINAHFYYERPAIPQKSTHKIVTRLEKVGTSVEYAKEGEIESGGDLVRFVQSSIVMDLTTAISIRDWLDKQIKLIKLWQGNGKK